VQFVLQESTGWRQMSSRTAMRLVHAFGEAAERSTPAACACMFGFEVPISHNGGVGTDESVAPASITSPGHIP